MIVVIITTIGNFIYSGIKAVSPNNTEEINCILKSIETIPETKIAEISLQAFILHQNHLRIKISPVPAPNIRIKSNSCNAFVNSKAKAAENKNKITVAKRPTLTNCFSVAL